MRLQRAILAGVLDSGLSSLATFMVGLYAVRALDPLALGTYALFFSAFSTLMVVSAQLLFLPVEIRAARHRDADRLGVLGRSLRMGLPICFSSSILTALVVFVVPGEVPGAVTRALLLTATLATVVSPIQDHIRKVLHIGGRSWKAAAVSAAQLLAAIAGLAALAAADVPPAWHPFGALAAANFVSSGVGLLYVMRVGSIPAAPLQMRELVYSGKWLLLAGLTPNLSGFAAASLVAHLASAQALGYAEAARILARPIAVLALAMDSVIGPRLMVAAAERDAAASRRLSRIYALPIAAFGCLYLLVSGFDWWGNPLSRIVPNAYVITGLTAASIAAYSLDRVAGAGAGLQLMGARRERSLGLVETGASLGRILVGLTAPVTHAFAIPLGFFAMAVVRQTWLRMVLRRWYAPSPSTGER